MAWGHCWRYPGSMQAVHRWSEKVGSQLAPATTSTNLGTRSFLTKARWISSGVGKPSSSEPTVQRQWLRDALAVDRERNPTWQGCRSPFLNPTWFIIWGLGRRFHLGGEKKKYSTNKKSLKTHPSWSIPLLKFYSFLSLSLFFFMATPVIYGLSQARGQIGAAAAGLHPSYSNVGSEPCPRPTPQLTATPDP